MSKLKQLEDLTKFKYLKSLSGLQEVLAEENRLRQKISRLREQALQAETVEVSTMVVTGADILWRGWCENTLTRLNTELAQVLAHKEYKLAQVRKEFSRQQVSSALVKSDQSARSKRDRAANIERAIEMSLRVHLR